MRRVAALLAVLGLLMVGVAPVSANSDPHRAPATFTPFQLDTSFCPFVVDISADRNNEYITTWTAPDGSTVQHVTGALVLRFTRDGTDKSVAVDSGGPGTFIISPDGSLFTGHLFGRSTLYAPNLTAFGYPSNVVATAGPIDATQTDFVTFAFDSMGGHPTVLLDICAALG